MLNTLLAGSGTVRKTRGRAEGVGRAMVETRGAGKGFAVVAGEVKDLSGQVGDAARNMRGQTTNIIDDVHRAVSVHDEVRACRSAINDTNADVADTVRENVATVSPMDATVQRINARCDSMVENVKQTADDTVVLAEDVRQTYESMLKFG
jgi:methyl-accepting chemotaxis protein